MKQGFEQLGQDVADELGPGPTSERLAAQRSTFVEATAAAELKRARWRWLAPGLGAALAVAAVLVWFAMPSRRSTLACTVVGGDAVVEGTWFDAGATATALHFSEGSDVIVEPEARARLVRLSEDRVQVAVESGQVRSAIVPDQGIEWIFEGGPYRVRVVGTRLRVHWDPSDARLRVAVDKGRIEVEGGVLSQSLPVSAGEQIEVDHLTEEVRRTRIRSGRSETDSLVEQEPFEETVQSGTQDVDESMRPEPSPKRARPHRRPRPEPAASSDWRGLARAGRYHEAARTAQSQGMNGLLRTLPADELALLADACRLGRAPCARPALVALRRRFAGAMAAKEAAFKLGRLAVDREGDHRQSAQWFRAYLREAPQGRLANEARGRLVEALLKSGDEAGARTAARAYLERTPTGPYAPLARRTLEEER